MSSTAAITGTITSYVTGTGPSASLALGSPTVSPSSTSGPSVTFDESLITYYSVPTGAPTSISLGTIAEATLVYVGASQACTLTINTTNEINIDADGFVLISGASVTALSVEADSLDANVSIALFGA